MLMEVMESPSITKPSSSPGFTESSPSSLKATSPASQYERLESKIGEGTYGKVHKARDVNTGQIVAIKKSKVSDADVEMGGIPFTVLREIKLMQAVRHPNVMSCLDVFADGGPGGVLHLVMDFMDGDLKKIIDDQRLRLSEAHVKCLSAQLLEGLAALHRLFFLHRDVTPTNVLLSFRSGAAKLTDFGMARTLGHSERPLTPVCTTLWYRAPELLYGARFYGFAVDTWSAACIMSELFLRKPLFLPSRRDSSPYEMLAKIFEKLGTPAEDSWSDVSALPNFAQFSHSPALPLSSVLPSASTFAQAIIGELLSLDPKKRPSAAEALQREFFTSAAPLACKPYQLPFVQSAVTS